MTLPRRPTQVSTLSLMQPKTVDFLVIGASKSGTTALFHYLRQHPALYLPAAKDLPFFSDDEQYARGWLTAAKDFYTDAPPALLWGAVTPRYMEDPRVPERIRQTAPGVRLIALLRNPIDRAFSQYRQQVRLGKENRRFAEAVAAQLAPDSLAAARRGRPDELPTADAYLARGEYGRILGRFRNHFPADRLLVIFAENLAKRPQEELDAVCVFLGLEPGFEPTNLGKRYHVGGNRQRFPRLVSAARRIAPLRAAWHLMSRNRRKAIWTWFFTQANVVRDEPPNLDANLRRRLAAFYRDDVARLTTLTGEQVPWSELRDAG